MRSTSGISCTALASTEPMEPHPMMSMRTADEMADFG
jgi:hypothetical protein